MEPGRRTHPGVGSSNQGRHSCSISKEVHRDHYCSPCALSAIIGRIIMLDCTKTSQHENRTWFTCVVAAAIYTKSDDCT